tara:strand:+ start:497 stop:1318 length:822 start_codon:yes stop_codon:yes gene_type:complete
MKNKNPIENLKKVMALLRDPKNGCPWDNEQTFASVAPFTIEEAYEVSEAILSDDMNSLKEELGDLLLQIVFHSRIAEELGHFDFDQVVESIVNKMIRRHPHVFGKERKRSKKFNSEQWEVLKANERFEKSKSRATDFCSVLDDVAIALPALMRAEKLGKRASKVGFDWPNIESVFSKVFEEINELRAELKKDYISIKKVEEELGDILLSVVSLARHINVDPELALRNGNNKFEKRFRLVEKHLAKVRKKPEETSLKEYELLWKKAKINKHPKK